MGALRFGVLGPLRVRRDGEPVPVPPGRRRAVLACLLVHHGHPVPADTLVEAGWGAQLPRDPRAALNTVLSRLRTVLGPEVLATGPAGYLLEVPASAIDAHEFETLRRRGAAAPHAEANRLLAAALALWRGPAYAEFADREFAVIEAQRLDRLRLDTVEAHAAAAAGTGDTETAVAGLTGLLAAHPFREHAVELLMTTLYRAGRHPEALARYRDYTALLADEMGLAPSPTLRDLEARILGHDHALTPDRGPAPIPTWLDTSPAFIGREAELPRLGDAVKTNRVVTVTGPGGVGKSRLVAQALPTVAARMRVPVTIVELAPVTAGGVTAAVGDALSLGPDPTPDRALLDYLGMTPRVLVLDNCEHLVDEVAALVGAIGHRCPQVHVLATSRHRLGVAAELLIPLEPLTVPAERMREVGRPAESLRLFRDRIRRLTPAFELDHTNLDDVAAICRRLDGLPLALELAASRAAIVGVSETREHLVADLIDDHTGDLAEVVAWSYRLLTDEQRRLLDALAVFTGDFDLDAVRGLAGHLPLPMDQLVPTLSELVESSLLTVRPSPGRTRYRMLALVHAYALRRLTDTGESAATYRAHAAWVRDLTADVARRWPHEDGALLGELLNRSAPEIATAINRALRLGDAELAGTISADLAMCLHWTPGRELSAAMIDAAEHAVGIPGSGPAAGAGAFRAAERGELDRSRRLAAAALENTRHRPDRLLAWLALGVATMYAGELDECAAWFQQIAVTPGYLCEGHSSLSLVAYYSGDVPTAREHARIALTAGPSSSDASHAFARYAAGEAEAATDPARAMVLFTQAVADADRISAEQVSRVARIALFALQVRAGRHDESADLGVPLLDDLHRGGLWPQLWTTVRVAAELLAAKGREPDSVVLLAASGAAPTAPPPMGKDIARYAALSAELRLRLGARVVDRISRFAAGLPRAQVVDRAIMALRMLNADRS